MRRVVILHGTDACPHLHWFQWLKAKLKKAGYKVWIPILPNNHNPNRETYNNFILGKDKDYSGDVFIGHSSGGVAILNLLMDDRMPKIKLGIIIGAWSDTKAAGLDTVQFKYALPANGFDFEKIKRGADELLFIHGEDDPYCPLEQAKWLAEKCGGKIVVIPKGHHLGVSRAPEFPELIDELKKRKIL